MNIAILTGRLTRDPEMRHTTSGTDVCTFTIAVDRQFKNADGQREADFIRCVAFKQKASFISQYFHKGDKINLTGTIQTRSWDDANGVKQHATEIVVDQAEFGESKRNDLPDV